ncbi:MAG: hypothetical protein H0V49_04290 [Nocardioidaceae bacterium]|nr:hypothetical protein [Nocardioidaceae bacterium]
MTPRLRRLWTFGFTVLALSGCANSSTQPEAQPESLNTSAPATSAQGPDPDTGGGGGQAILLPRIPIGGNAAESADPEHPANQCVDVNWIADQEAAEIPSGVEIVLTGFVFNPDIFAVAEAGCSGENPPCLDYVFSTNDQACDLAIEPLSMPDDLTSENPSVSATGEARCDDVESPECTAFVAAVETEQNVAIPLNAPVVEETATWEETTDPTMTSGTTGDPTDGETTETQPTEGAVTTTEPTS